MSGGEKREPRKGRSDVYPKEPANIEDRSDLVEAMAEMADGEMEDDEQAMKSDDRTGPEKVMVRSEEKKR